jgi:hypothetical protein
MKLYHVRILHDIAQMPNPLCYSFKHRPWLQYKSRQRHSAQVCTGSQLGYNVCEHYTVPVSKPPRVRWLQLWAQIRTAALLRVHHRLVLLGGLIMGSTFVDRGSRTACNMG